MSGEDETTHLPASLQKFFKVTLGMEWPEGSEGGLRAISGAWADFAEALDDAASDVTVSSADIAEALRGVTGAAIVDFMRGDLHTSLDQLRDQSKEFSKTAKNAAADIQKTKIMLIAMAAMALATVISLIASLFGAFLVPGVLAAARVGLGALLRELVAKVGQLTLKQVLNKLPNLIGRFALDVGKYAAGGAAIMSGLDLSIQAGQNASGGRDGIDWNSVKNMAIGGAIGGAGAGVVGGIGRGTANFTRGATKNLSNGTRDKVRTVVGGFGDLAHAGGQMAVVVPTNVLTNYATGGKGSGLDGILGAAGGRGGGGKHAGGGGEHGGAGSGPSGLTGGFNQKLDGLGVDGGDRPVTGPDGRPVGAVFTQGGERPVTESGPPVAQPVAELPGAPAVRPAAELAGSPVAELPGSPVVRSVDGAEAAGPPASTVQQGGPDGGQGTDGVHDTPAPAADGGRADGGRGDVNAETTTPSRQAADGAPSGSQVQRGSTGDAPATAGGRGPDPVTGNQDTPTQGAPAPDTREGGPNAPETVGGGDRGGLAGDAPAVGSRIGGPDGASSANSEGPPAPVENDRAVVGGDRPAAGVQEGGAQEQPVHNQGTPAPAADGRGATTDGGHADTHGPDAPAERGTTPFRTRRWRASDPMPPPRAIPARPTAARTRAGPRSTRRRTQVWCGVTAPGPRRPSGPPRRMPVGCVVTTPGPRRPRRPSGPPHRRPPPGPTTEPRAVTRRRPPPALPARVPGPPPRRHPVTRARPRRRRTTASRPQRPPRRRHRRPVGPAPTRRAWRRPTRRP